MTYKELKQILDDLTEEQLEDQVELYDYGHDRIYVVDGVEFQERHGTKMSLTATI